MTTFRNCPFCGSAHVGQENNGEAVWIECFGCGAMGPPEKAAYDDSDMLVWNEVTKLWNTRKEAAP